MQEEELTLMTTLLQMHWLGDLKTPTGHCTDYLLGTAEMIAMPYHVCTGCSFPYHLVRLHNYSDSRSLQFN